MVGYQDQLFGIQLGVPDQNMVRPLPVITIQNDYLDCPYGHIHEPLTDKPSHLAPVRTKRGDFGDCLAHSIAVSLTFC